MIEQRRQTRKLRGFTLIEVLVSVVIFSVGLLGLAGLQATGLKLNQSSMLRSHATLLAYDVLDSMRANKGAIADYALEFDDAAYGAPANQAERDINNWLNGPGGQSGLIGLLPQGDGSIVIVIDAITGRVRATITVRWDDSRGAEDLKTLTLVSDI